MTMTDNPGPISLHNDLADKVLGTIRGLNDPATRVQFVSDVLAANGHFVSELAALTREAVAFMHDEQGKSYAVIGRELGISRARAQQLANGR